MKNYEVRNNKNTVVYYRVNEEELKGLEKKVNRYGWTVKEIPTYRGEERPAEKWNEGLNRENWAV